MFRLTIGGNKMKNFRKNQVCLILVLTILFTSFVSFGDSAYGFSNNMNISTENLTMELINNSKLIEKDILSKGIDIQYELEKQVNRYRDLLNNANNIEDIDKLQSLLNTSNELLDFYNNYKLEENNRDGNQILAIDPGRSAVKLAIAAITSFFNFNGYFLSSELLLHAQDNQITDSIYHPYFGSILIGSPVIHNIRRSPKSSGKDEFNSDGTKLGNDLYFAIHGFSWEKEGAFGVITVRDRYDYAVSDYDGIQDYAVNAMYWAQEFGYIVPFQVRIYDI